MKEMNEDNKVSYYAIIPANVRYDPELTEKAKLLYGEITCLSNKEGYCFATNNYFANLYNCTTRAIQNAISKLQERGYIKVVIEDSYQRKIFMASPMGYEKNFIGGYEKKFTGGYEKKFTNNNINNNKLDSLFNYIIKKEKKIPKEFENFEIQIFDVLVNYEMLYSEEIISNIQQENVEKIKTITYALATAIKENVGYLLYKVNREQIISLYDECKIREKENKGTDNEIQNFTNYYYKSLKGQLLKDRGPSFFMPKNEEINSLSSEEDEEGEEI